MIKNIITINCDVAWSKTTWIVSCGGLIGNGKGESLDGFACNLGENFVLQAEMGGIFH